MKALLKMLISASADLDVDGGHLPEIRDGIAYLDEEYIRIRYDHAAIKFQAGKGAFIL